jgi:anhydro-N-acetylmuramic acid kinase
LQIGDPNVIAIGTGIATAADFRRADMALGGQGAPLAPAFHQWLFADAGSRRVILNIGGIANVSLLPGALAQASGFDTGPGNTLLDSMARENLAAPYDDGGTWAASGNVSGELLQIMLADEYFSLPAPKSTGFEYFNADWLNARLKSLADKRLAAVDVQATLAELSARSIAAAILGDMPAVDEVFICGGGVHNPDLVQRIVNCLAPAEVASTEACGLHPDWVEAVAFAWLAMRRLADKPGNLPAVTGASRPELLGAVYRTCPG